MAYLFLYICLEAGAFGDTNEPEYAYESNEMKESNPCLRCTFTLFRLPQEEALRACAGITTDEKTSYNITTSLLTLLCGPRDGARPTPSTSFTP